MEPLIKVELKQLPLRRCHSIRAPSFLLLYIPRHLDNPTILEASTSFHQPPDDASQLPVL